jgi:Fur family transcriptional regulator, ferric uptake regulator
MDESRKELGRSRTAEDTLKLLEGIPAGTHVNAMELFELARQSSLSISLSSIYRHLSFLEHKGAIIGVSTERGRVFEIKTAREHHHLICIGCGQTTEFVDSLLERFGETLAERIGFEFHNSRFDILGICLNCRKTDPKFSTDRGVEHLERVLDRVKNQITVIQKKLTNLRNQKDQSALLDLQNAQNEFFVLANEIKPLTAILKDRYDA